METKASYMIVGTFTLVMMVGLVSAVVWLAGVELDEEFAAYDLYFEGSVTGLKVGNPVRYRGVPVGQVTDMKINPDNVEQVKVTIEVPNQTPIKEDAIAALEYQGITGVAFVQIEGGSQGAPTLKRIPGKGNPVIKSKPSQIQEVIDRAPELLNRFIALVENANKLLNAENQENLGIAMANIKTITGAVAEGAQDISTVLTEGATAITELRATASEARQLVKTVQATLDTLTSEVSGTLGEARSAIDSIGGLANTLSGEVTGVGPQALQAMQSLKRAADSLEKSQLELTAMVKENREPLVNFTNSGLYEITQLIAEARVMVSGLSRITGQFERDPARFLFGDSQQGVGVR
jgi:phospholipid/cholesterol/gamma-HCH transport system substrate-binding protein